MSLILASSSPRRQELLRAAGIEFTVQPADLPEVPHPGEAPQQFAERMAREKAAAVAQRRSRAGDWVLAADTVVFVNGEILGKPADAADPAAEGARMLRLLSGREHRVITGVCLGPLVVGRQSLATPPGTNDLLYDIRFETTQVWMDALSEDDIRDYIATGEPLDKAGAYAIQGAAAAFVERVQGDRSNVVGLPQEALAEMLREFGVRVRGSRA